jgi:protein-S-isoprenylcysteine O-methyltransferase Ste14
MARKESAMSTGAVTIAISAVWLCSELVLNLVRRARTTDQRIAKSSFQIIWLAIMVSVAAGVYVGLRRVGHIGGDSLLFPLIGVLLMICGIILRWTAIITLKRQFTVDVAITSGHRLVREGIYRYLRHPAYAGSLLSFFGLGLSFGNYISIIVIVVPICSVFLYRIHVEERALMGNFGDAYRDYCASTKRLIPYVY